MKLSIIIPIYNSSMYLERCLDCIVKQTFKDFELIIVDDESGDNSLETVSNYINEYPDIDIRIKKINHSGSSIARKKGLEIAKGEYIGFVDSDDYIDDNYFEILLNEIDGYDIIATNNVTNSDIKNNNMVSNKIYNSYEAKLAILNHSSIYQYLYNKIYKRELFDNVIFPNADMIGEDFLVVMQLINNAKTIKVINDVSYYYNPNDKSQSRAPFCDKHINMYREFNKLLEDSKNENIEYINSLKRYILLHYMAILVSMTRNNIYDKEMIKDILEFVKINKKDYLLNSTDSLKTKIAVIVASTNYRLFNFIAKIVD